MKLHGSNACMTVSSCGEVFAATPSTIWTIVQTVVKVNHAITGASCEAHRRLVRTAACGIASDPPPHPQITMSAIGERRRRRALLPRAQGG
jgi:hypothetical protein